MIVNLFVGLWFANFLGVAQFGVWSYALVLVAFGNTLMAFGFPQLLVKELAAHPEKSPSVLYTTVLFRFLISVGCIGAVIAYTIFFSTERQEQELLLIFSLSWLPTSFEFIESYFIGQSNSKQVATIKVPFSLIANAVKVGLIMSNASVERFAWLYVFEFGLPFLGLVFVYSAKEQKPFFAPFDFPFLKQLLAKSWPLMVAALAVYGYMRIDQLMIKAITSDYNLGIYSMAVKLVEPMYLIPVSLAASSLPILAKAFLNNRIAFAQKLTDLYRLMTWLSLGVIAGVWLLGDVLVALLLDESFSPVADVLKIYSISFLASSWGVASTQFLMVRELTRLSMQRTLIGLIVNVLLNLWWIPLYAETGAASATVVSYFVAVLSFGYHPDCRKQVRLMLLSFDPLGAFGAVKRYLGR